MRILFSAFFIFFDGFAPSVHNYKVEFYVITIVLSLVDSQKLISALLALVASGLSGQNITTAQYIENYKDIAMQEMKKHGIPASITLAQGILESASGNSKLAKDCNNHFGIKCRKNWTAKFCLADDDAPNECFRGYQSAAESYHDHSAFLKENSRYATLFTYAVTDYVSWAHGLRSAGYATNPAYGSSLITVIQKHKLSVFDSMVVLGNDYIPVLASSTTSGSAIREVNGIPVLVAGEGQTAESIAETQEMGAWQIYKYNDLKRGEKIQPGDIVFLKPKRRNASIPVHVVKGGEDMRSISQLHGIKLKHLYKKNNLKPGQQIKSGDLLYMQKKRTEQLSVKSATVDSMNKETTTSKMEIKSGKVDAVKSEGVLYHQVKQGETLYSIARMHRIAVDDLMEWNSLNSNSIKAGQKLVVQSSQAAYIYGDEERTETMQKGNQEKSSKFHLVEKGETLYRISKKYGLSVERLKKINGLDGDAILPGQRILLDSN